MKVKVEKKNSEVEKKKVMFQNKIIIKFNPLSGLPIIKKLFVFQRKKKLTW